jgi:hypothetical protein
MGTNPIGADKDAAEQLATEAVYALHGSDEAGYERCLRLLTVKPNASGWEHLVDRTITARLQRDVTELWRRGWQPADVVRMANRRFGAVHARLATDTIAAEMLAYTTTTVDERWLEQLSVLNAQVWWQDRKNHLQEWRDREGLDREAGIACVLEVLSMFAVLPRLEQLGPLPGAARRRPAGADDRADGRGAASNTAVNRRILSRVRALLSKAESTDYPAEAETFTAGAQAMMARHSIDAAMLWAESGDAPDAPRGRRLGVDAPYETAKAMLVTVVAQANRCQAVWNKELGFSTVIGFPADLDAVELLHTSLLVQAMAALVKSGTRAHGDGQSKTRAFRSAFLTSYAQRIGERLSAAAGEAVHQASAEPGHTGLLPALAARDRAIEEAVDEMFGKTKKHRVAARHDLEGWMSGRAAADVARLQENRRIPGSH